MVHLTTDIEEPIHHLDGEDTRIGDLLDEHVSVVVVVPEVIEEDSSPVDSAPDDKSKHDNYSSDSDIEARLFGKEWKQTDERRGPREEDAKKS